MRWRTNASAGSSMARRAGGPNLSRGIAEALERVQTVWRSAPARSVGIHLGANRQDIVYRKIRQLPPHLDVDDFISCGLEVLIRSIDGYDPDKGTTLEQHAWFRIHGAVLDELRRNDWAPRSLRRWERDIRRVRTEFRAVHGRAPEATNSRTPWGSRRLRWTSTWAGSPDRRCSH
jgi:Sigma-70 region 2